MPACAPAPRERLVPSAKPATKACPGFNRMAFPSAPVSSSGSPRQKIITACVEASSARAAKLHAFLLRQGVIVRPVGNYGLAQYLRITVGLEAENTRLLGAIDAWLAGGAH